MLLERAFEFCNIGKYACAKKNYLPKLQKICSTFEKY